MNDVKTIYDAIIKRRCYPNSGSSNDSSFGGAEFNINNVYLMLNLSHDESLRNKFEQSYLNNNALSKNEMTSLFGITEAELDGLFSGKYLGIKMLVPSDGSVDYDSVDLHYIESFMTPTQGAAGFDEDQIGILIRKFFNVWTDGVNFATNRYMGSPVEV